MTVSRRLATSADGRQVAGVALRRAVRALREVTDVKLRVQRGQVVASIANEGLLAHVAYATRVRHMTATVLIRSRVELCASRLVYCILIFSSSRAVQLLTCVMLMVRSAMGRHVVHRIGCTASSTLLAQLCLSDRLGDARVVGVVAAVARACTREPTLVRLLIEELSRHHHLVVAVAVSVRRLPLVDQVE